MAENRTKCTSQSSVCGFCSNIYQNTVVMNTFLSIFVIKILVNDLIYRFYGYFGTASIPQERQPQSDLSYISCQLSQIIDRSVARASTLYISTVSLQTSECCWGFCAVSVLVGEEMSRRGLCACMHILQRSLQRQMTETVGSKRGRNN